MQLTRGAGLHFKGVLLTLGLALFALACARKISSPVPAKQPPADDYMDLLPHRRLRVVVPILNSGGPVALKSSSTDRNTITLTATNLSGYDISHFTLEGHSGGRVKLHFTSADITRNGSTIHQTRAPAMPFPLPANAQHIRLIYLIRNSAADHNMAIAAAKNMSALGAFTDQLKTTPDICRISAAIFCAWVPPGVAVRPE